MNELALFAGAGGGILGGHLLGWRTVCAVERDAYAAAVLAQRQNDGTLRPFPIWSDIRSFDGKPWRGIVDVVSGGFPCQDISVAGKGDGLEGERSGMWREMARVVGEVRPFYVVVENSPMLTSRGLGTVLGDLAALRFDAGWQVLSAAECGARHKRDRIWIVAHAHGMRELQPTWCERNQRDGAGECGQALADTDSREREVARVNAGVGRLMELGANGRPGASPWPAEPGVGRMAHGVAARMDRLKALGNGQVSRVAATAFRLLSEAA